MSRKLPSFEDCLEIAKNNECFTHRYREVNGYKVSIFNYLLATYKDFKSPVASNPNLDAFELRGICFTHDKDMKVVRRFVLLHKFFNLNQCEDYQYEDLKNKKITQVMDKMDGSVMRFIELPNKEIVVKSKTFFDNDQTRLASKVYENNPNLKSFVKETLDQGLAAIFELTSPVNSIVLKYKTNELTLLQLRDESTGKYLNIYNHPLVKKYNIKTVDSEELTLDQMIALKETLTDKEGWVFQFGENDFGKLKTNWYCERHGLLTETLNRENLVMDLIIKDKIDDALAELEVNDPRRIVIEEICQKYNHYVIETLNQAKNMVLNHNSDQKDFAIKYKKNPLFHFAVYLLSLPQDSWDDFLISKINKHSLKETYHLEKARSFVKEKLNSTLLIEYNEDDLDG